MKDLVLGLQSNRRAFKVPADIVSEAIGIFGIRGAGKSVTARDHAEELAKAGLPVVVIDPKGDWWGIKSDADGKKPGLPFYILGGDRGDVPLEFTGGEVTADFVVDNPNLYVLDLSDMRKGQQRRFFTEFAERLYFLKRKHRDSLMVVVDEADLFAPQSTFSEKGEFNAARMVGAAEDIVRRGRQRGLGSIWATQRPASLHTGVRTQVSVLVAMRISGSHDLKAIEDWVSVNGTPEQAKEMMAALPSMDTGTGYVWSPHFLKVFERVQFRLMDTFDSFATPKAGERLIEPKVKAEVDLSVLSDAMAATIEKAKENDPRALKAEVAKLRSELDRADERTRIERQRADAAEEHAAATVEPQLVQVPYVPEAIEKLFAKVRDVGDEMQTMARMVLGVADDGSGLVQEITDQAAEALALGAEAQAVVTKVTQKVRDFPRESAPTRPYEEAKPRPAVTTPRPAPKARPVPVDADEATFSRDSAPGRIAVVLARFPEGRTDNQAAMLAKVKRGKSTWGLAKGAVKKAGFFVQEGGVMYPTQACIDWAGADPEPLPTGKDLLDFWVSELGAGSAPARILVALYKVHPNWVHKNSFLELADVDASKSTFGLATGKLNTFGLIRKRERGSEFSISEDFFQ